MIVHEGGCKEVMRPVLDPNLEAAGVEEMEATTLEYAMIEGLERSRLDCEGWTTDNVIVCSECVQGNTEHLYSRTRVKLDRDTLQRSCHDGMNQSPNTKEEQMAKGGVTKGKSAKATAAPGVKKSKGEQAVEEAKANATSASGFKDGAASAKTGAKPKKAEAIILVGTEKVTCPECETEQEATNTTCEICGTDLMVIRGGEPDFPPENAGEGMGTESTSSEVPPPDPAMVGDEMTAPKFAVSVPEGVNSYLSNKVYRLNKDLEKAKAQKNTQLAKILRIEIGNWCSKSNGVYVQNEYGFAAQMAPSAAGAKVNHAKPKGTAMGTAKAAKTGGSATPNVKRYCPCCGEETGAGSFFVPGHDGRVKGIVGRIEKGKEKVEAQTEAVQAIYRKWKEKEWGGTLKEVCIEIEREGMYDKAAAAAAPATE